MYVSIALYICNTRVAKELRAGNPDGAKHVVVVAFKQTIVLVDVLCLALLNHHVAGLSSLVIARR